ncbi:MAG: hypothetical protein ABSF60_15270 [Verrucomicrobiota bacterium]|jgi:hypothetical protein
MKIKSLILLASSSLLLAGCTTEKITDYQPASPSISESTAQESGVEVALDPFVESARTKKYFDIDAVAHGIAILHVRVANKTANQTFLVKKEDFQLLRNGSGDLTGGEKIESSSPTGQVMGVIGAGALMGLVGIAMVSHAAEVQRNFMSKEMGDQTLAPGENMEGFIYFAPVNHGEDWTRTATVKIKLAETKTQQSIELKLPLSH